MILDPSGLETSPTGTLAKLAIINGNWELLNAIFNPETALGEEGFGIIANALAGQGGLTTIAYAASVDLDLRDSFPVNLITLAGNLTVAATNKAAGRWRFLIVVGDGSTRTLTWPGGAVWAGPALTSLPAGQTAVVLVFSSTTADSGLVLATFKIPTYAEMGIVPAEYGGTGQDNSDLVWPSIGTVLVSSDIANVKKGQLMATINDGGAVLSAGFKCYIVCPFAGTITAAKLLADVAGDLVVDLYKCTYADYDGGATHPVSGDKITASAPPTLSSEVKSNDSTLTGWTTTVAAGDIIAVHVTGTPDAVTLAILNLEITKD